MEFIPTIGLEIHLELNTKTKMFCKCLNDSNEVHPNVNICEVCTGQPGTLPVVNKNAIIYALKLAKALEAKINESSYFVRKNYFYPDLPKNYQISQYAVPLSENGQLNFWCNQEQKTVRIRRVHLEEDTGKLIHTQDASLVDFNRAGVPLLEIVTEPDLHSGKEAKAFAEELILISRYLKISGANPDKGEIRMEANVSVAPSQHQSPQESASLGTKVEIKNLNSLRSLEEGIDYEIQRQEKILRKGEKIVQETRGWDEIKRRTFSQRTKEEAEDYRYFPEPDLPPLRITESLLNETVLPELPEQRRQRFQKEFGLPFDRVQLLAKEKEIGDFFEEAVSELHELLPHPNELSEQKKTRHIEVLYNFLVNDVLGLLVKYQKNFVDVGFTPHPFAHLIVRYLKNEISSRMAKDILEKVIKEAVPLESLLQDSIKISDVKLIQSVVSKVLTNNQKVVQDYKKGKREAIQFLVGQTMKVMKGQADPEIIKEVLTKELEII
jgi:aspartyl-tRNA(Asn)/glutamyl-tRNA(Gln) amidotransferase subunit B